jgi:hypothetical protein
MIVILVLALTAGSAVAVMTGLALVVMLVHREDRRMSLKRQPGTPAEAAARRLLGVGVRQPEDDDAPTARAGQR